jgi:hypothetical protein
MAVTNVRGRQLKDDDVLRQDLNTTTSGSAVIRKGVSGTGIALSSTGVDAGTGDVTISLAASGVTANTYGSASQIPVVTVDTYGRITAVSLASVAGGSGTTVRYTESFTAIANQTVFTTTNTLTAGYYDVYLNGVRLNTSSYSVVDNSITLADGATAGDIVDVIILGNLSVATTLPSQTGNGGKYLTTDGTNVSWATVTAGGTGTVTSVAALTIGTTGTDLSSSVATGTTTPVITLNVPTASATNRGALSSTDWSTFNGKQAALNGTGFVKISGSTISYDNSTYYLASNPSGYTTNTGTVTSVSVTTANGVSGSVATATSTPAITITLGAITPSTVNGLTFTAAATGFTIAGGTTSKTLTVSNTITLAGTDASTLNIGAGGTLGSAAFTASTAYQASNTNLTSLAGLSFVSTSFVKMTAAGTFALDTNTYYLSSNPSGYTTNTGTVTTVSVTTANGVSGSVATAGTTPAITITLGAITPTSVNSVVISGSTTPTLAVTGTSSISGSNTGDNAVNSLYSGLVSNATHTGDATGATALTVVGLRGVALPTLGASAGFLRYTGTGTNTWVFDTSTYITGNQSISVTGDASGSGTTAISLTLATVNSNLGTFNNVTVNAKGLVTAASNVSYLTANQSITLSGAVTGTGTTAITTTLANSVVGIANLSATGTASGTTYLRGDNTWATIAGGGITTLNTLTDLSQSFATSTTGTDFTISSATGVHTFNLPDAGASARGLVTTGVQTIAGVKTFTSAYYVGSSSTNANFGVIAATGIGQLTNTATALLGAGTISVRVGTFGGTTSTLGSNFAYATHIIGAVGAAENVSGTHPLVSQLAIRSLNLTDAGATTTNGATLYIEGATIGTATITNNYAVWIDDGAVRLDILGGAGTRMVVADATGVLSTQAIPAGGSAYSVTSVSTTYSETATSGTKIIKADTSGGTFVVTLPTAVGNTATIIVKKTAGTAALTVDGAGTETIDGGLTAVINKVYESITLISDNTNWQIV